MVGSTGSWLPKLSLWASPPHLSLASTGSAGGAGEGGARERGLMGFGDHSVGPSRFPVLRAPWRGLVSGQGGAGQVAWWLGAQGGRRLTLCPGSVLTQGQGFTQLFNRPSLLLTYDPDSDDNPIINKILP